MATGSEHDMTLTGARIVHATWSVLLAILVFVFVLSLATEIVLRAGNPGKPKIGQPKSFKSQVRVATAKVQWRDHVDVGNSEVVSLSLVNPGSTDRSPCGIGGGEQGQVNPVGKRGVPLSQAFGPSYAGYASAYLDTVGFDVAPGTQEEQSLDQSRITWDWVISPKVSGQQYVVARISGTWRLCYGNGQAIHRQLWMAHPIALAVDQPLLQRNSFDLIGFLTGTTGASSLLLAILAAVVRWIHARWDKRSKDGSLSAADKSSPGTS